MNWPLMTIAPVIQTFTLADNSRQPIAGVVPVFRSAQKGPKNTVKSQLLGVQGLALNGRCLISYIHPNVSTHGPPTSSAVQVNLEMALMRGWYCSTQAN